MRRHLSLYKIYRTFWQPESAAVAVRMPVRDKDRTFVVRVLTAIAVGLAIISLALAIAWKREHESAKCWRAMAEDDYAPDCARR